VDRRGVPVIHRAYRSIRTNDWKIAALDSTLTSPHVG
jgi:hypothetical protein